MTSDKVYGQKGLFWSKSQKIGHVTYGQTHKKLSKKKKKEKEKEPS